MSKNKRELLKIKDLSTYFYMQGKPAKAVDGVTFDLYKGEILGIVGESGSGKSVTALSVLRLIPEPPGKIVNGQIIFNGKNLLANTWEEMRAVRGNQISMIFQEPMTSLNPVFSIGMQIAESLIYHNNITKKDALDKAVQMLELVGIPSARNRLNDYPHQFSGGMRQRVMIAMALACEPDLLIADEPTTALDVTIQAQILKLMLDIKNKQASSAILLITHDLAVIAETCNRVVVMYCGKIQEMAEVDELFDNPMHPYTTGLLKSIPSMAKKEKRLFAIPGNVPSIFELPAGCSFCTRCDRKMSICESVLPDLVEVKPGHFVRCHLYNKV